MTRTTAILLIALGTAASAFAAVGSEQRTALEPASANETVIEKNQAYPHFGPIEVEECLNEDCSLTLG
jgi:hypothetical protein